MARVVLIGNLAQLTAGVAEFDLSAPSVKQLFQQLAALHPDIARHLEDGVAVAIDGQIDQDALLEPIGPETARCSSRRRSRAGVRRFPVGERATCGDVSGDDRAPGRGASARERRGADRGPWAWLAHSLRHEVAHDGSYDDHRTVVDRTLTDRRP